MEKLNFDLGLSDDELENTIKSYIDKHFRPELTTNHGYVLQITDLLNKDLNYPLFTSINSNHNSEFVFAPFIRHGNYGGFIFKVLQKRTKKLIPISATRNAYLYEYVGIEYQGFTSYGYGYYGYSYEKAVDHFLQVKDIRHLHPLSDNIKNYHELLAKANLLNDNTKIQPTLRNCVIIALMYFYGNMYAFGNKVEPTKKNPYGFDVLTGSKIELINDEHYIRVLENASRQKDKTSNRIMKYFIESMFGWYFLELEVNLQNNVEYTLGELVQLIKEQNIEKLQKQNKITY